MEHLGPELTKRDPPDPGDIIVRTKRPLLDVDGWAMECFVGTMMKKPTIRFHDISLLVIGQGVLLDMDPNYVRTFALTNNHAGLSPIVVCSVITCNHSEGTWYDGVEWWHPGTLLTFVWEWACERPGGRGKTASGAQFVSGFRKVKK